MQVDFRVLIDFPDNRKTKRMIALLGEGGVRQLLRLWSFARTKRPKGILLEMDKAAIGEVASGCTIGVDITHEAAVAITDAFLESGFIDVLRNKSYALHDWKEINPFAVHAENRRRVAQKAAKARWNKKHNGLDTCSEQQLALLPANDGNAPIPTPNPIPNPPPLGGDAQSACAVGRSKAGLRSLTQFWKQEYAARAKDRHWTVEAYSLSAGDQRALSGLLEDFPIEDIKRVMVGFLDRDDAWVASHGKFDIATLVRDFNSVAQTAGSAGSDEVERQYRRLYAEFAPQCGTFDLDRFIEFCQSQGAADEVLRLAKTQLARQGERKVV